MAVEIAPQKVLWCVTSAVLGCDGKLLVKWTHYRGQLLLQTPMHRGFAYEYKGFGVQLCYFGAVFVFAFLQVEPADPTRLVLVTCDLFLPFSYPILAHGQAHSDWGSLQWDCHPGGWQGRVCYY
ncbi:hypothetical protein BKA67DRAFT_561831 [Truncatella angustata]|uniref:Uncharacterized protein n=1 Tax=Truncatella angustata TaxID=152316 RepID=A0A9P8UNZ0_9PEZI|nr:uncharacterized protein BKA67DRAFT_561831 [Truncatella angustata]KAH6655771.1 hypothetical protein BKA67DRAFT_561831 [Truncatella angustata]